MRKKLFISDRWNKTIKNNGKYTFDSKLIFIFVGGFFGAILRYLCGNIAIYLNSVFHFGIFPTGTLFVNALGVFFLSYLSYSSASKLFGKEVYSMMTTGFVGSFTTFSTLSKDISIQLISGNYFVVSIYIFLTYVLSIFAIKLSKKLIGGDKFD